MNKVLKLKKIKEGEQIGLVKLDNEYFWRYKNYKKASVLMYPRKKFHSLKAFEKFVNFIELENRKCLAP